MQLFGLFLFYLLAWFSYPSAVQPGLELAEICDNGVDDDGDGRVDQNDEDCFCELAEAVSLIPNPSFENQDCCPNNRYLKRLKNRQIKIASNSPRNYLLFYRPNRSECTTILDDANVRTARFGSHLYIICGALRPKQSVSIDLWPDDER